MCDFIKVNDILGHQELRQFDRFKGGKLVTYGYSIRYDRNGKEVSRTGPTAVGAIGWDDGSPFTIGASRVSGANRGVIAD